MTAKLDLRHGHVHYGCARAVQKWTVWATDSIMSGDAAMIDVRRDYLKDAGPKVRNMVRKAGKNGLGPIGFNYNDHLDAMHAIDVSMPKRGGMPMTRSYIEPHKPVQIVDRDCDEHATYYLGVFERGHSTLDFKLVAYSYLVVCGDLAVVNRFIGHADYLRFGAMNMLLDYMVYVAQLKGATYLNYLTMESRTEGLSAFKRNAGFRPMEVVLA